MKFIGHLKIITKHKSLVIKHCFKCGIPLRGLLHDLSKYSPEEFIPGVKYYTDGKRSPNESQREISGYSSAWLHHKGRNKHHYEYWYDINTKSGLYEPVRIPITYLKESFCDRVAASKIYRGKTYTDSAPLEYFMHRGDGDMMHPISAQLIKKWLQMLSRHGEDFTFAHIRKTNSYEDL